MSSERSAPAIILSTRSHGDTGLLTTLLTEAHGRHIGLAKGGQSRNHVGMWQPGNLVEARWIARPAEQFGAYRPDTVHAAAALAVEDALSLSILTAAYGVADSSITIRAQWCAPRPLTHCFTSTFIHSTASVRADNA